MTPKIIFYLMDVGVDVDVDVGGGILLSLNLLIKICYIFYISLFFYAKGILAKQKSYGFKIFEKLEVGIIFFKITAVRTVFNFSIKTSCFVLVFSLFE